MGLNAANNDQNSNGLDYEFPDLEDIITLDAGTISVLISIFYNLLGNYNLKLFNKVPQMLFEQMYKRSFKKNPK